ncbi:RHS repeat domain-containing protein [Gracilinema caldarium]|uniref:RHS repeat domain-containing protein n=1 Tax=Gracilinema caldarium TaxID=215591 RepID=UPI0026E97714|nr:RHS repeat domain-containing protein [Gracilinema caldarium]
MKTKLFPCLFILVLFPISASDWYRSSPGGIALEQMGKLAALRQEYALEVYEPALSELPEMLQDIGKKASRMSAERLYHNEKVTLSRYKFWDGQNKMLYASQFDTQGYSWIECYDTKQQLIEEYWAVQDSDWFRRVFVFAGDRISVSKTFAAPPMEEGSLIFTDFYRYDRSGLLRIIERVPAKESLVSAKTEWFSKNVPSLTSLNRPGPGAVVIPETIKTETLQDIIILYNLDSRGRVIREQHKKQDGSVLYERTNVWEQDRLVTVTIDEQGPTKRIEYTYDAQGNRISEKYYAGTQLERQIIIQGNQEIEELYDKGQLVLKTIWVNGIKIQEQRPRRQQLKP